MRFLRSNAMGACSIALDWALLFFCFLPAAWQQWSVSSCHAYFPSACGLQVAPRVSHWFWFSLLIIADLKSAGGLQVCLSSICFKKTPRSVLENLVATVPSPSNPKSVRGRRKFRVCHCSSRLFLLCRAGPALPSIRVVFELSVKFDPCVVPLAGKPFWVQKCPQKTLPKPLPK